MSYTLGSITLPRPKGFRREVMEKSQKIVTLDNTTKKDITGRKERFILTYAMISQADFANILGEFNLMTTRNFTVSETNLTISATPVHIEMDTREYNTGGNQYLEDFVLILEEVS